ncbi:unnamed protein product [Calypogeia fissa]
MVNSGGGDGTVPEAMTPVVINSSYDDLYEGYNDFDPQILVYGEANPSRQATGERKLEQFFGGGKPDVDFSSFDPMVAHSQTSSMSENQGGKSDVFAMRTATPLITSMWRPSTTGKTTQAQSMTSAPQSEISRPMTAVRAAGYSSRGSRFDPLNQGGRAMTPAHPKKEENNPEYKSHEMERLVNQLLEESASASVAGDHQAALEKAKEAGKKERLLCKHREQTGLGDQLNLELTFAVCFNLGCQYHNNGLQAEALSTYSQIVRNKQFIQGGRLRINMGNIYYEQQKYTMAVKMYRMALDETSNMYKGVRYRIMRNIGNALMKLGRYQDAVQSYEDVIEIKVDHQSCYNLIVCCYILGHVEKMKSVFKKMLLVKHYNSDSDDDIDGNHIVVLKNDVLQEELRSRQNMANKYIFTAGRLIAPVLGETVFEGYDCLIEMLKDKEYLTLASEMEMDKAMQHLRRQDFGQAVSLLKNFEKKEKDLRARAATNLSFIYFLEGDVSNAEKHAEVAVKTNQYNSSALVNHGNCFFSRGDMEGAISLYREAVEVEADFVEAIYNIGLSYKRLGSLADALCTFKKLSNLLPNNVEVLFQIGHVNEMMGNYLQAIKWLEIVNTQVLHDSEVLAMLGGLYYKLDDEPKALHYYIESHRAYPTNMDITSWLGAFYVRNEVYNKAMPYFALASKVQPTEVKWQLMVASCFRRTGQYKLALAKYKAILANNPDNVECLRYLVHMCNSLGRKEELAHYESRLRTVELQAQQHSRAEKQEGGSGKISTTHHKGGILARTNHDNRVGSTQDDLTPASSSGQLVSLQKPGQRMISVRKYSSPEIEWPELGDDLLPM